MFSKNDTRLILLKFPLVIISIAGFIYGCTENDGNIGEGITESRMTGEVVDTVLYPPVDYAYYSEQVNCGGSYHLYLGQYSGFKAKFLLKFSNFFTLPDSFRVDSAQIKLKMGTIFGDTSMTYPDFLGSVYQVLEIVPSNDWMESNVVWDSVLAWDDSSIFDFSVSQAPDSDSISFNIDTSIVNHWISADSANPNTGLIFDYSGDAQFARQFLSSEMPPVDSLKRPQLILYITPFDSVDSVLWQADTTDTIRLYATNDVFIAVDTAQLANNRLYLGRAVAYRSLFRYDFSQIFPLFGVYINKAEFILFVDSENPLNVGEYSTVKFGRMNDTLWIADAQQADYTDITYLSSTISGDSITLNITPLVRSWVAEPDTNFGLAVHFTSEVSEMARAPLFTPQDPDSSKRPYLHIIYSEGVEP